MGEGERNEFLAWYESKESIYDNRQALESYCQDDVTFLRQVCRVFRREFMHVGNIEVFLESVTIASACNKVLRKRFLQPDTIGLLPTGGYTCNNKYSKKTMMWFLHMEQNDGVKIRYGRNGREYKVPELPHFSVDGYCPETKTIYEFNGCVHHGHTCRSFRDVTTTSGETLAERYERPMSRLEQITREAYQVKIEWECEFDESGIVRQKPELLNHPIVRQSPLRTRDALYGGRTETMRLHYKQIIIMKLYNMLKS